MGVAIKKIIKARKFRERMSKPATWPILGMWAMAFLPPHDLYLMGLALVTALMFED